MTPPPVSDDCGAIGPSPANEIGGGVKRRVVITGLGAVTALGEGAETLWKAVLEKRSGI